MKPFRQADGRLRFQLATREKELLLALLELYPSIPADYRPSHRSSSETSSRESQLLLDRALADHRKESRRQLEALLADNQHLVRSGASWDLSLSPAELDWLLQVLNDVRVGSWIALGSPAGQPKIRDQKSARQALVMETAGIFQMSFLESLRGMI